ncbi:HAL/PAL/TAL family ammonia-lyase [Desmospora profundinema]|uniref:Histidine ammonia-lyase/phenylalanine ammonia-lyase n=1 Tax=Desmospora profundinema TaxID=1571184 RepID=A0ABU1IPX4_9BACL|nr:aromatic amino acid ammonia-lyase [Desmospora profundinema]MDR6226582.1 histidine ammonia-lyase/phenylalanine ammonia-lyase [Desmospora profundinema]
MKTKEAIRKLLSINGSSLEIEDIVNMARKLDDRKTVLSKDSVIRMECSDNFKNRMIDTKQPIYGVTTGFGDSSRYQISPEKTADLQLNMVKYHLNGTGPTASDDVIRATMLIRANCLAKGNSGIRPVVVHQLLEYLNKDIIPVIPERGSVGASGDLIPLSYLASAIIGEGQVKCKGQIRDIKEVLDENSVNPIVLEAKEGLSLINGTSFMTAFAVLAVWDAKELAFVADLCTAMATEALMGDRGHFHPFIHQVKPHEGQLESARLIYEMLSESRLARDKILSLNNEFEEKGYQEWDRPIQDRYSIRCAPHVTGVLRDTIRWVKQWVEVECNSSNDNPLFDVNSRHVYNGGNFYGGHIVQAMDSLKVAVSNIADLLDRQLELVVDEKFNNNLTPNLIPRFDPEDYESGLNHGFKGMQLASSAITAEALKMSGPVSVFSRSTEAHNQDKVSMGTIAARDARTIIELVREVSAIHLLVLCQALELRGVEYMGDKTQAAFYLVREQVPFVDRDRRMDQDIQRVVELIKTGRLRNVVGNV